jgi:hypothetical protein
LLSGAQKNREGKIKIWGLSMSYNHSVCSHKSRGEEKTGGKGPGRELDTET